MLQNYLIVSPNVVAREVGGELVLLDLTSGTYFGLDPVGMRVWQLIQSGKSLAGICEVMLQEYEITSDVLERDVLALAEELIEKQIVAFA